MSTLNASISKEKLLAIAFPATVVISVVLSIAFANLAWMAIPFSVLLGWMCIDRTHWVFFLCLALIPFSMEKELPGGFSTDFPDEPMMWILSLLSVAIILLNQDLFRKLLTSPITWILIAHWIWILFTTLTSQHFIVSFKWWLSKSWYISVFYVLAYIFLNDPARWTKMILVMSVSSAITILYVESRHALEGFSFDSINLAVRPFYRNHVNYACMQVVLIPFIWAWWRSASNRKIKWLAFAIGVICLGGITFSYTRAAYIALLSILPTFIMIRYRLLNLTGIALLTTFVIGMIYINDHNKFLDFAPDYNKAITHHDFGHLLAATPQGKDISTMERLYRWVAGTRMTADKSILGFGPGNFYDYYKPFTLTQFTTYVSENRDRSTVHNYLLMTAVEQGIPGLFLFLSILYLFFREAGQVYSKMNHKDKPWLIACIWCMSAVITILLFNDMVETDKVGAMFFICLAIITRLKDQATEHPAFTS